MVNKIRGRGAKKISGKTRIRTSDGTGTSCNFILLRLEDCAPLLISTIQGNIFTDSRGRFRIERDVICFSTSYFTEFHRFYTR